MFFIRVALLTFTNIRIPFDRVIGEIGQTEMRGGRRERQRQVGERQRKRNRQTDRDRDYILLFKDPPPAPKLSTVYKHHLDSV